MTQLTHQVSGFSLDDDVVERMDAVVGPFFFGINVSLLIYSFHLPFPEHVDTMALHI